MWSQTTFQFIIVIGLGLTALGGFGAHIAGKAEAEAKEQAANERIDLLERALTQSVEQNARLVAEQTAQAVEESTKAKIRADHLREAQKKLDERRKRIPTAQQRALGICPRR